MWRLNYRKARDLDHLSPEELSERMHDCINNVRTRTERGKLGISSLRGTVGLKWITLYTETLEECVLRGYTVPGPIDLSPFRSSLEHAFDQIPDIDPVLDAHKATGKPFLLKFGQPKWLRQSLNQGKFRIASASYYDSDSHNHARRDRELQRFTKLNPRNPHYVSATTPDSNSPLSNGDGWKSISYPTDYYLYSLSASYSARLFGDFASSACLLIHDTDAFFGRLNAAIASRLPGWNVKTTAVTYYDPVRVNPVSIAVPTYKAFKHEYQDEVRIICLPPSNIKTLPFLEIEIGSLEDCATVVDLSTHPAPVLPHDPTEDPVRAFGTIQRESEMLKLLPSVAKIRGIILNKEAPQHADWYFQIQYTDAADVWHELRIPMLDGLYLLNLLQTAQQDQHLDFWNPKVKNRSEHLSCTAGSGEVP